MSQTESVFPFSLLPDKKSVKSDCLCLLRRSAEFAYTRNAMNTDLFQLDHVQIGSETLHDALQRYKRRGFRVESGGFSDATGASVAQIRFENGTGLQFVEMHDGWRYMQKRKRVYRQFGRKRIVEGGLLSAVRAYRYFDRGHAGYKGYALLASDTEEAHERLRTNGYRDAGFTDYYSGDGSTISCRTYVDPASLAMPIVYVATLPPGQGHANAAAGLFRLEIGSREPAESVRRLMELTGNEILDPSSSGVPRPTIRVGAVNIEFSAVDTALEEGVLETGILAGFPGHNVLYAPETNDGAAVHMSYRSAELSRKETD